MKRMLLFVVLAAWVGVSFTSCGLFHQPRIINGNAVAECVEAKVSLEIYMDQYGFPVGWDRMPDGCERVDECLPKPLMEASRVAAKEIVEATFSPREDRKNYVLWTDGRKEVRFSDSFDVLEKFVRPLLDEMGYDWRLSPYFWETVVGRSKGEYLGVIRADFKAEISDRSALLAAGDDFPFSEKQLLRERAEILFPGRWGQDVNLSALGITPEQARRIFGE